MDARQALDDLMDVSSQIESAVICDESGEIVVSTIADDGNARRFAQSARDLFAAAEEAKVGNERLTHLEAATRDGSVFIVCKDDRTIAATTAAEPTVALVFYDLRTCLENAAEKKQTKKRAPRKKKAEDDGAS